MIFATVLFVSVIHTSIRCPDQGCHLMKSKKRKVHQKMQKQELKKRKKTETYVFADFLNFAEVYDADGVNEANSWVNTYSL